MKKILKILGIIIFLLVLLIGIVHLRPIRKLFLNYAIQKFEEITDLKVNADELEYNLFKWKFSISNLILKTKSDQTRQSVFQLKAQQVIIDLASPLSWKKGIHFQNIQVMEPEIEYSDTQSNDESTVFMQTPKDLAEKSQFNLPKIFIDQLIIKKTRLLYRHQKGQGGGIEFPNVETKLTSQGLDMHFLALNLQEKGVLYWGEEKFSIDGLSLKAILDRRNIDIKEFSVRMGENWIKAFGSVHEYTMAQPRVDITIKSEISSPEFAPISSYIHSKPGKVFGDIRLAGSLHEPNINVHLKAKDFLLAQPISAIFSGNADIRLKGYSLRDINAQGDFNFKPEANSKNKFNQNEIPMEGNVSFDFNRNQLSLAFKQLISGGISINGLITKKSEYLNGEFTLAIAEFRQVLQSLKNLRMFHLDEKYIVPLENAIGMNIGGNGKIRVKIGGSLKSPRLISHINATLYSDKLKPLQLSGMLDFNKGILRINDLNMVNGRGNMQISGVIPMRSFGKKPTNLTLNLKGDRIHTDIMEPFLNITLHKQATVSFNTDIEFNPNNNTIRALVNQLDIQSGIYYLKSQNSFHLSINPAILTVENLNLQGSATFISANGHIGLNEGIGEEDQSFLIETEMDCDLLSRFFPGMQMVGKLNFKGDVKGSLSKPVIMGQLDLKKGELNIPGLPAAVENIGVHLLMTGEKLELKTMVFDWQGANFLLSGEFPFLTLLSKNKTISSVQSNEEIRLELSVKNISMKMIDSLIPQEWSNRISLAGRADLHIHGPSFRPELLTGYLNMNDVQLDIEGFKFRQQGDMTFRLKERAVTLEKFFLSGLDSELRGYGSLEIMDPYPFNVQLAGQVQSRVLNGFWEDIVFLGTNAFNISATGDINHPQVSGEITLQDAGLQHLFHLIYMGGLEGKIKIENGQLYTEDSIEGSFNGGEMSINKGIGDKAGWNLQFKNTELDIPWGILSNASGSLILGNIPNGTGIQLEGKIQVNHGFYKESFGMNSRLVRYLRQISSLETRVPSVQNQESLVFNIEIFTENPLQVDNNIAKAEITAMLKLTGTSIKPILAGRAEIKEGGEIYLGKNTFFIERGFIHFSNPFQIEPEMDIIARTRVADTDIRLNIGGTTQAIKASLSSTPSLPESHIIALLVSGKPMESNSPSVLSQVGNQTLTYLGNTIAGKVEQTLKRALGIETVRIDGSLVAAKENPDARLTLGHHLTSNLELIMSQSLIKSQDRAWIVNYKPLSGLNLQAVRLDNDNYLLGINHALRFGLDRKSRELEKSRKRSLKKKGDPKISAIEISSDLQQMSKKDILKYLKIKKGKPFRFFQFQKGLKRLKKKYQKMNHLNVQITSKKEIKNKAVQLLINVNTGPRIFLDFIGKEIPRKLRKKARKLWIEGHFDEQRINSIIQMLRQYLFKKNISPFIMSPGRDSGAEMGHPKDIWNEIIASENQKQILFHINGGRRFKKINVEFSGHTNRRGEWLKRYIKKSRLKPFLLFNPQKVIRDLEHWYRQQGFLNVRIFHPEIQWSGDAREININIPIEEGERFTVGDISIKGNYYLMTDELKKNLKLRKGDFYISERMIKEIENLETFYAHRGYYNTRLKLKQRINHLLKQVDVELIVSENPKYRINSIGFRGNQITKEKTLRRELRIKSKDILDLKAINKTRKNLYDMGIFKRVNIEILPLPHQKENEKEQLCDVEIQVIENQPFELKYGVQLDTENALGMAGELTNSNIGGKAILGGASFRYNQTERDFRLFSRLPGLLAKKMTTELFLFSNWKKDTEIFGPIHRYGITWQQQWRITPKSVLTLGYTFEKYQDDTDINLGHITASFMLDTRNNFISASRGFLLSQSFQYSGKFLGSDIIFARYLGQLNIYHSLTSRLVSASSLHVGLGSALNQPLLSGERFFAGGSTTIRGFKYNRIGPLNRITNEPEGGDALFIFKQELRYQLFRHINTVLFLDIGNVYARVSDFNPLNIRSALGFGFRFNIQGLLLRFDWGFKLDRRPGESLSHLYLSIGHSF